MDNMNACITKTVIKTRAMKRTESVCSGLSVDDIETGIKTIRTNYKSELKQSYKVGAGLTDIDVPLRKVCTIYSFSENERSPR